MKKRKHVARIAATIGLLVGLSFLGVREPAWSLYTGPGGPPNPVAPFVQCDVGLHFPTASNSGPFGLVPMLGGEVLAVDNEAGPGLYTFVDVPTFCSPSYVSPNINSSGNGYLGLAQGFDGKLYATNGTPGAGAVYEISAVDGHVIRTLATGLNFTVGITVDPMNGDLYFTDQGAQFVYTISNPGGCGNPCSATKFADLTPLAPPSGSLAIDGLAWSPDTFSLLVAANATDQVILVDRNGTPSVFVTLPTGTHPDGIAFGLPGTPLWTPTPFAFTNNNNGTVIEINMKTKALTTIASGGSRGDFITVDDQGCLLATQTDRVTRLCGNKFTVGGGGLCNNLQIAAAGATNCSFCVSDPSIKATITKLVKPICGNVTCNPALAQKQLCTLISYLVVNAPNCTGLLTAARTLRDQLSSVSPSPCPGT